MCRVLLETVPEILSKYSSSDITDRASELKIELSIATGQGIFPPFFFLSLFPFFPLSLFFFLARHEWNNSRRRGPLRQTVSERSPASLLLDRFNIVRTKIDNPPIYVSRLREVSMESQADLPRP